MVQLHFSISYVLKSTSGKVCAILCAIRLQLIANKE